MTVKIIIERRFKEIPKAEDIRALNELRTKAMQQDGYVSGETLVELEDNRNMVVISVWSSLDEWDKWFSSQDRRWYEDELKPRMESPPNIRSFMLGTNCLREILARAVHDAKVGI